MHWRLITHPNLLLLFSLINTYGFDSRILFPALGLIPASSDAHLMILHGLSEIQQCLKVVFWDLCDVSQPLGMSIMWIINKNSNKLLRQNLDFILMALNDSFSYSIFFPNAEYSFFTFESEKDWHNSLKTLLGESCQN